jgi:transcriptional antiterminator NusG
MTMQRKVTGKKVDFKPMIEAELSETERSRAYARQRRVQRAARIAAAELLAASRRFVDVKPKKARWFCLQVEKGREFAVEKRLLDANVEAFMPREKFVHVRRGEKIEGEVPFFPSYMLVRCVPSSYAFAGLKRQKHVIAIVGGASGYHIVRNEEVERFKAFMADGETPRVAVDKTMADGDRADIVLGPFAGFMCLVISVKWSRQPSARVAIDIGGRTFDIESMPLAFLKKV